MDELNKPYDPKDHEEKIYRIWEESGYFAPEAHQPLADNPNSDKTFCMVLPPPNITGSLHMGHALNATIQDILIRYHRMRGFKTLWLPGTDHAGIATQYVVEKELKKEGKTRFDLGKEEFLKRVWDWREKYGHIILDQLKKIGASCDWSRARFTLDKEYTQAVETAFNHYYEKGWVYQADRVINWCSRCATSLSDLEAEYQEEEAELFFIKYPLASTESLKLSNDAEFIIVATTRPETMLGDAAVAVNPKDERYKKFVDTKVVLPIQNREIPIIADEAIDMEFGTGAVKVTPAHDALDFEIHERHNLPIFKIIDEKGRMTAETGEFQGMKILECRQAVVKKLENLGLIEKIEKFTHNISKCYRCGTVIEPLISKQWFLKMKDLAQKAVEAVESGQIKFHPDNFKKTYLDWLKNIRDWAISRQLWWGHKIPLEGVDDVLDTWFSSALWPFATLGWPDQTDDLKNFYPTQTLSTARDIINLWVARMIYSGLEFTGKNPFSDIIIHATVLNKEGKRMSKSLSTGIDPLKLISEYGADATRFAIIWQAMGGQDIKWQQEAVLAGKKFLNKIWNSTRYVITRLPANNYQLTPPDPKNQNNQDIIQKLKTTQLTASELIASYEFGQALHVLYDFFWHDFCDNYIEQTKKQPDEETNQTLIYILASSLKMLHPFIPFITETLWAKIPIADKKLLIIENWNSNF